MPAPDGTEPIFGFAVESYGNGEAYFAGLTDPRSLRDGEGVASWCNLVSTADGGDHPCSFQRPGFPNREAAKARMATGRHAQLKALQVSLRYA